jgi:hypothetical protein
MACLVKCILAATILSIGACADAGSADIRETNDKLCAFRLEALSQLQTMTDFPISFGAISVASTNTTSERGRSV